MNVIIISCGPAVNESEIKAIEHLKGSLAGSGGQHEWILLTNLTFSTTHRLQSDEIDIIALGPPGVRVIEVKHWTGAWVNRHSDLVDHEADRLTRKARKIGTTLRSKIRDLPHVDGVFFVTQTPSKVEPLRNREIRGARIYTFKTWRDAVGVDSPTALSHEQVRAAARLLEPKSGVAVAGELRRLAGYTRLQLQTPVDERFHRVYHAIHSSRQDRVVLHLYDWSASDDPNALTKARREFDALHRLQLHGWAPRIVDSFQEVPNYPGEVAFFTVADPAAPSVDERAEDESWNSVMRLSFSRSAVRALNDLHEARVGEEPMVHRNLSPSSILVMHDNSPILTAFEYARIPREVTVASPASTKAWGDATAPEVRVQGRGAADVRSDIFALCASLRVLFNGRDDSSSQSALATLSRGTAEDPDARIALSELEQLLSEQLGESVPAPPPPPARFWTEGQIVPFAGNDYRIVAQLGSGGVGTTFKVVEIDRSTKEDLGAYVGKVVRDREAGERVLLAHRRVRSYLRHTGLSSIYEVAREWQDNEFAALMAWIEGEPLIEWAGMVGQLAEDQEQSVEDLVLRWLNTVLKGLRELHRNGLVHGDVSPRNLILSGVDVVLTDYDCVGKAGEPTTTPGTVLYCAPSHADGLPAKPADDFFALAASIFHVLFAKEPFLFDGILKKTRGPNWSGIDRAANPKIAAFIERATAPDPERRFATAADALRSLDFEKPRKNAGRNGGDGDARASPSDLAEGPHQSPNVERRENQVPWLGELLRSYPGSLKGNRETRGLDSEFAARTYVETTLERNIYRDVEAGTVRLVVLCGNAGDGKTALLQRIASRFGLEGHRSGSRTLEGQTETGLTVRVNLDGSAAWNERSSDELIDEFLGPFLHGQGSRAMVHLLAINDGRLLDWIDNVETREGGATPLTAALTDCLEDGRPHPEAHIRFVNLNERSLVGGVTEDGTTIDTSFLDRLVDSLYGGARSEETWAPCESCSAQDRCEVFRAVRLFGPLRGADASIRSRVRQRLFEAMQAVHLRGETHITMRELRASLVYILFGVHYCTDYHAADVEAQPYWDRAFNPESPDRQGEVLREMVRFDPALEAHPQLDRVLVHPPRDGTRTDVREEIAGGAVARRAQLGSARRRAYFEWTENEITGLTGDPDALGLAQGVHLRQFRDLAVADPDTRACLAQRLCSGISRLEALPPQALGRAEVVPLRVTPRTPTETAFWVEKHITKFDLKVDLPAATDLDHLHRQALLVYRYRDGQPETLRLGAELFHLLLELEGGYQLGDIATDDTFAHLSIFVQRLVREEEGRVFAWSPMAETTVHELSIDVMNSRSGPIQRLRIASSDQGETDAE